MVQAITAKDELDGCFLLLTRNKDQTTTVEFKCLNPKLVFRKMMSEKPRSLVLTSGTLRPLESFADELGVTFHNQFENKHIIKQE